MNGKMLILAASQLRFDLVRHLLRNRDGGFKQRHLDLALFRAVLAIRDRFGYDDDVRDPMMRLIKSLLKAGADPNKAYDDVCVLSICFMSHYPIISRRPSTKSQ